MGACGSDASFLNPFAVASSAPSKASVAVAIDDGSMVTRAVRNSYTDFLSALIFLGIASQKCSNVTQALRVP